MYIDPLFLELVLKYRFTLRAWGLSEAALSQLLNPTRLHPNDDHDFVPYPGMHQVCFECLWVSAFTRCPDCGLLLREHIEDLILDLIEIAMLFGVMITSYEPLHSKLHVN